MSETILGRLIVAESRDCDGPSLRFELPDGRRAELRRVESRNQYRTQYNTYEVVATSTETTT